MLLSGDALMSLFLPHVNEPAVAGAWQLRAYLNDHTRNSAVTPAATCTTLALWTRRQLAEPRSSPCAARSASDSHQDAIGGRGSGGAAWCRIHEANTLPPCHWYFRTIITTPTPRTAKEAASNAHPVSAARWDQESQRRARCSKSSTSLPSVPLCSRWSFVGAVVQPFAKTRRPYCLVTDSVMH
jgi:hypothetical protein